MQTKARALRQNSPFQIQSTVHGTTCPFTPSLGIHHAHHNLRLQSSLDAGMGGSDDRIPAARDAGQCQSAQCAVRWSAGILPHLLQWHHRLLPLDTGECLIISLSSAATHARVTISKSRQQCIKPLFMGSFCFCKLTADQGELKARSSLRWSLWHLSFLFADLMQAHDG